jgi:hypothetical protein
MDNEKENIRRAYELGYYRSQLKEIALAVSRHEAQTLAEEALMEGPLIAAEYAERMHEKV